MCHAIPAVVLPYLFISACGTASAPTMEMDTQATALVSIAEFTSVDEPETTSNDTEQPLWAVVELEVMALTLAGECYDDKEQDKRLVCEVILNRVSSGNFPDSIVDVVTQPKQFDGYWTQSRPVTQNDYDVAAQTLSDWFENGCQPLSEWLFFEAGENRENEFRSEF